MEVRIREHCVVFCVSYFDSLIITLFFYNIVTKNIKKNKIYKKLINYLVNLVYFWPSKGLT